MRVLIALAILSITTPVYAQTMGSTSGAMSMVDISSPANTTSTSRLITTPTVAAPGLAAAGVETCLGSAVGGLSLMGGGFTFGSTKVDEGCTIRLLARQLFAFGFHKAAVALMCEDRRVAIAMDTVGSPCPTPPAEMGGSSTAKGGNTPSADSSASPTAGNTEPIRVSFMPVKPFSPEEQAWFDRAEDMN